MRPSNVGKRKNKFKVTLHRNLFGDSGYNGQNKIIIFIFIVFYSYLANLTFSQGTLKVKMIHGKLKNANE